MLPVTALDSVSIPARSWPAPDRVNVSDDDEDAMASLDDRVGTCRRDASGKIVIFLSLSATIFSATFPVLERIVAGLPTWSNRVVKL